MKKRSLGWALIQCDWCPYKKISEQRHTEKEDDKKRQREKTAIYKPRREARNRSFLQSPQKEPPLPTP